MLQHKIGSAYETQPLEVSSLEKSLYIKIMIYF